ncbi:mep operon protein MepB [Kurthia sibirica]|uniref:Mep operon protein MepB n=2 Tax=Kurthia sibirica TaxID=202750 RepID=A0A2U3AQH0_9BACL|nr:mep operon protein MepB [Kurthia sibirica]
MNTPASNHFIDILNCLNKTLFTEQKLNLTHIEHEWQNAEYGAGIARIEERIIRFRTAKITPTKIGQFAVFWQKNEHGTNEPFSCNDLASALVIHTLSADRQFIGQFVFPKQLLIDKGILSTSKKVGKMAMRVYPIWDKPTSKQAQATQKWQLPYFFLLNDLHGNELERWTELYRL